MSLPELSGAALPTTWLTVLALAVAAGALLTSYRIARRSARERRRIDAMQRDLQIFAEASTRVADSLDHLLRGDVEPAGPAARVTSSRRYLLHEARERLERGEPLETLTASLGLCEDEQRLLDFVQRSGSFVERVRVA
ncbi:MAG: hypothetical protein RIC56_21960 [Pseudomonadales bacterium]